MNLPTIIQILQTGVVGLAFLLAYMAYRLLSAQSKKKEPNQQVIDATSRYMGFALLLSLVALGGQVAQQFIFPRPAPVPDVDAITEKVRALITADFDSRIQRVSKRIDGIHLLARDAGTSPPYGCGNEQRAEVSSLTVMYGLRDGTGCGVANANFYKELVLTVPQ